MEFFDLLEENYPMFSVRCSIECDKLSFHVLFMYWNVESWRFAPLRGKERTLQCIVCFFLLFGEITFGVCPSAVFGAWQLLPTGSFQSEKDTPEKECLITQMSSPFEWEEKQPSPNAYLSRYLHIRAAE